MQKLGFCVLLFLVVSILPACKTANMKPQSELLTEKNDIDEVSISIQAKNIEDIQPYSEEVYQLLKTQFTTNDTPLKVVFERGETNHLVDNDSTDVEDTKFVKTRVSKQSKWYARIEDSNSEEVSEYSCLEEAKYVSVSERNDPESRYQLMETAINLAIYNCFASLISQISDDEAELQELLKELHDSK